MQWLSAIPKGLFVAIILIGGVTLILLANPPHTVCDSQIQIFHKSIGDILFQDKKYQIPKILQLEDECRGTNSPGGCYELFHALRALRRALSDVPEQCYAKVGNLPEVKRALHKDLQLMIQLAWGGKPPATIYDRNSWLDYSDLSLFCGLKSDFTKIYGEDNWQEFFEQTRATLPGANQFAEDEALRRTIIYNDCRQLL